MPLEILGFGAKPHDVGHANDRDGQPQKTTMKLAPKHDHSVEIPPKTYDVNSEISYGINSARNTQAPRASLRPCPQNPGVRGKALAAAVLETPRRAVEKSDESYDHSGPKLR